MGRPHTVPETVIDYQKDRIRLDRSTLLHENWDESREAGFKFYKISDGVGKLPPLYALSRYDRTIDPKTGDSIEEETILQLGELSFDSGPPTPKRDYLEDHPAMEDVYLPLLSRMNEVYNHFQTVIIDEFIQRALDNEFEGTTLMGSFSQELAGDMLTVAFEFSQVRAVLCNREGGPEEWGEEEWGAFLTAVNEYNDFEAMNGHGFGCQARLQMSLDGEDAWRLNAVEIQHNGVFKHRPALAAVKALQDSESTLTQSEMADILGTNQGNISRQLAEVEEWRERTEWMADHW